MEPVKPKPTLVEQTYDILVDAICDGELQAGERLNQDEIAAKLNVSRQPVNSAISILKTNGLVQDTGRRGVVVCRLDHDLFMSILEYRKVIEPFAVRLAGRRIVKADRRRAEKVLRDGEKACRSGTLRDFVQADMQFHQMIYGWSANHAIQASMKTNWHHIRRSMAKALREPDAARQVWQDHAEIIKHLFDGDTEDASRIMERHIEGTYKTIVAAMATRTGEAPRS